MGYNIKLPTGVEVDIFDLSKDFDDIVRRTFAEYTQGTSKEYRYVDKLGYIDCFIERLNHVTSSWNEVANLVKEYQAMRWDEENELITNDDIYCVDFMETCYNRGYDNAQLNSRFREDDHHIYDQLRKVLDRVITIVMNYDDTGKQTLYVEYVESKNAYRIYKNNDYYFDTIAYIDSLDELTEHKEYNYLVFW